MDKLSDRTRLVDEDGNIIWADFSEPQKKIKKKPPKNGLKKCVMFKFCGNYLPPKHYEYCRRLCGELERHTAYLNGELVLTPTGKILLNNISKTYPQGV